MANECTHNYLISNSSISTLPKKFFVLRGTKIIFWNDKFVKLYILRRTLKLLGNECSPILVGPPLHCSNGGPKAWLNELADFERVLLAGVSAHANIAHNLAYGGRKGRPRAGCGSSWDCFGLLVFFWVDRIGLEA